jgi:hypothetical protein
MQQMPIEDLLLHVLAKLYQWQSLQTSVFPAEASADTKLLLHSIWKLLNSIDLPNKPS